MLLRYVLVTMKMQEQDYDSLCELRFREQWQANRPILKPRSPGDSSARLAELRNRVTAREATAHTSMGQ